MREIKYARLCLFISLEIDFETILIPFLALTMNPSVYGFSIINHSIKNQRLSTKIFLKDSIADM